ncbi:FAD-dependent oxidoreductase [Thermocatellispora tengchongensis]|uniref:FAD-dependent oxidoreductase n=1 Tax=Thermocatellispora tengchongensis TaxID=1073253 RepID=UPI0036350584
MRVVVIGAGVGGLALARGLVAAGHRVTVYEQADGLRTDGGSVTLWSGSTAILRGLGADPLPLGRRIDALEARAAEGGTLFTVDLTRAAAAFGAPAVHVLRQSLVEALAAGLPEGTVRYGRRCVRAAGGGLVEFQDGSAADGDVVVGADGRRSVVRKHALGGDPARPTAWITWQGVAELPAGLAAGTRGVLISGREGLCGLMPAGAGRLLWWFDERAEEGSGGGAPVGAPT